MCDILVWTNLGSPGLSEFFELRQQDTDVVPGHKEAGYSGCFHDGRDRVGAVDEMLNRALNNRKISDNISEPVARFVLEEILRPEHRFKAEIAWSRFMGILRHSKEPPETKAVRQSISRQHFQMHSPGPGGQNLGDRPVFAQDMSAEPAEDHFIVTHRTNRIASSSQRPRPRPSLRTTDVGNLAQDSLETDPNFDPPESQQFHHERDSSEELHSRRLRAPRAATVHHPNHPNPRSSMPTLPALHHRAVSDEPRTSNSILISPAEESLHSKESWSECNSTHLVSRSSPCPEPPTQSHPPNDNPISSSSTPPIPRNSTYGAAHNAAVRSPKKSAVLPMCPWTTCSNGYLSGSRKKPASFRVTTGGWQRSKAENR